MAAEYGHFEAVVTLAEAGANINARSHVSQSVSESVSRSLWA